MEATSQYPKTEDMKATSQYPKTEEYGGHKSIS